MVYDLNSQETLNYYTQELGMAILEVYSISQARSTYYYYELFDYAEHNNFKTIKGSNVTKILLNGTKSRSEIVKISNKSNKTIKILDNSDLVFIIH
jgi:hypothetical protein